MSDDIDLTPFLDDDIELSSLIVDVDLTPFIDDVDLTALLDDDSTQGMPHDR